MIFLIFSVILKGILIVEEKGPLPYYKVDILKLDTLLNLEQRITLKTDKRGGFFYSDKREKGIYIVEVEYKGAVYKTEPIFKTKKDIKIVLFDSDTTTKFLSVSRAHIAFVPSQSIWQIIEVYNIFNHSSKTILKEFILDFPEQAFHIVPTQGVLPFEMKIENRKFIYNLGFTPGIKNFSFMYHIPLTEKIKFEKRIPLNINELLIMIPEGFEIKGIKGEKDIVNTPHQTFISYSLRNIKEGKVLKFEIALKGQNKFKDYIPVIPFIVGLIIVLVYLRNRWKKKSS